MNALLQNTKLKHLSGVSEGKLPQILQIIRYWCRRNSVPGLSLSLAIGVSDQQKAVKDSLRKEKASPQASGGSNIA